MASGILVNTDSGNGLVPVWHQAITWTNADLTSIVCLQTKYSEIWIKIPNFFFKKIWKTYLQNVRHSFQALMC